MRISYTDHVNGLTPEQLAPGFFTGWPNPPSRETHVAILRGSQHVWLARDDDSGLIVGFITALSDGVLCAFIPLLEVVPACQNQGIGRALVTRMFDTLAALYSVDLLCDPNLQAFYERFGMRPYTAMLKRNYAAQSGRAP